MQQSGNSSAEEAIVMQLHSFMNAKRDLDMAVPSAHPPAGPTPNATA